MPIEPGHSLLHYQVTDKLGEGGMGEVWTATDTKLGRAVAIKVLPEHLSSDAERLARFEREARLLASLNHANIATIHGIEQAGGQTFLVMELVEGEDLARRLKTGPLPLDEALDVARQMAAGIEAAHDKGVIHRDLKPANVLRTASGEIKILDFGLAKALIGDADTASGQQSVSLSPTLTSAGTVAGVILGTAQYMSPEQARGQPVDQRADVWAFGCVLYELLTGKPAFGGDTVTDVLAAVVRAEPDWDAPSLTRPRAAW